MVLVLSELFFNERSEAALGLLFCSDVCGYVAGWLGMWLTLATLEQLQRGIMMASEYKIGSKNAAMRTYNERRARVHLMKSGKC